MGEAALVIAAVATLITAIGTAITSVVTALHAGDRERYAAAEGGVRIKADV